MPSSQRTSRKYTIYSWDLQNKYSKDPVISPQTIRHVLSHSKHIELYSNEVGIDGEDASDTLDLLSNLL